MNNAFNPYHDWLGVSADVRFPNYYELLGIRLLEDNQEIIKWAAEQRSRYLEQLLPSEHGLLARQILGEIAAAQGCLLDQQSKAAYDQQLEQLSPARTNDGSLPSSPISDGLLPSFAPPVNTEQAMPGPPSAPFPGQIPHQNRQAETPLPYAPEAISPPTGTPPAVSSSAELSLADLSPASPLPTSPPPTSPPSSRRSNRRASRPTSEPTAASAPEPSPPTSPTQADEPNARSVPMVAKRALEPILEELDEAMQQCCDLYMSCVSRDAEIQEGAALELSLSQDRLHKYLLVKICATVAGADGTWSHEEQQCAAAVLRHVGLPFPPGELDGIGTLVQRHAGKLDWRQLFQPFYELPQLRDRMTQLQGVVLRVANLIATADGSVNEREKEIVQDVLDALRPARQPGTAAEPQQTQAQTTPMSHDTENHGRRNGEGKGQTPVREVLAASLEENLQRLDGLIGLNQVKREIYELANLVSRQSQHGQAGLAPDLTDSHFVFVGSAGTGKTTVARLLADILVAGGVLKRSELVEVDSRTLAENDPVQAQIQMDVSISTATGGVLLIDHASMLLSDSGKSSSAAMRVLLQGMAKHQGQLVVILADPSDRLRQKIKQRADLASVFARHLQFPDYSVSELGQIFQRFCDGSGHRVSQLAQIKLLLGFQWRLSRDSELFGSGHLVRQVFEDAVYCLGQRIAGMSPLTDELLTTFEDEDIVIDGVPAGAWGDLADRRRRFLIHCPGCMKASRVAPEVLGVMVKCNRCNQRFVCAWGEPCKPGR